MTERRLMPVHVGLVKEVLVERILADVLAREPADPPPPVKLTLEARLDLPACDGGGLDLRMRGVGYITRGVEAEMFAPAREPMEGLAEMIARRLRAGEDWTTAAVAVSSGLARSEPLAKPAPTDEAAVTWKVPGPGGHVRHFVVAAAIAEVLSKRDDGEAERQRSAAIGGAGELKRSWTYGFMVRCCEEALAPG